MTQFRFIFSVMWVLSTFWIHPIPACAADDRPPQLIVLLVIDQMRFDMLQRFAGYYTGGLAYLTDHSAVFTEAHQDHAFTETAAGHACIATGRFPQDHGIIGNDVYIRNQHRIVYSVADTTVRIIGIPKFQGRSPRLLLSPALGDYLKAASPQSKVFSVSLKDRAAVLMGGYNPDGVYWYNKANGNFVTSDYYQSDYPQWVKDFNAGDAKDKYYKGNWHKLFPEEVYYNASRDSFMAEDGYPNHSNFPHLFPPPDSTGSIPSKYYYSLYETPFGDDLMLTFAKTLMAQEKVGQDSIPDLMLISCSNSDVIGHDYGPLSQEIEDYYLRLDLYLADFITFLDEKIGRANYVLTLTSDHGVLPLPEELKLRGQDARRIHRNTFLKDLERVDTELQTELKATGKLLSWWNEGLVINFAAIPNSNPAEIEKMVARKIVTIPYIKDAFTYNDLLNHTVEPRPFSELYQHSFHPDRSQDIFMRTQENYLIYDSPTGTNHGSPYRYDTHVPLLFLSASVQTGLYTEKVSVTDIVPTLADFLRIQSDKTWPGRSLRQLVQKSGQ